MPVALIESDNGKTYFVMARCADHADVPQLNASVDGITECGGCIGHETFDLLTDVLEPLLDAYADRLTHHCVLRQKLAQARVRLNLLSPGAGDWLDADVGEEHDAT